MSIFDIIAKTPATKAGPSLPTPVTPYKPAPGLFDAISKPLSILAPKTPVSPVLPQPSYTVRRQTFEDVKKLPEQAKDFLFPARGFEEEELAEAKPTTKEKALALPKAFTEITTGLGSLFGGSKLLQAIADTKVGDKLADLGQKQAEFSVPKTAGEAKAMRFVDAGTFFLGELKLTNRGAQIIARTKNPTRIAEVLVDEVKGLERADADKIAPLLVDVDNADDAQRTINQINYAKNKAKGAVSDETPAIPEGAPVVEAPASLPKESRIPADKEPMAQAIAMDVRDGVITEAEGRKAMKELLAPKLPTFEGFEDITLPTLDKLTGRAIVSKQFIADLTNSPEIKQAERAAIREALEDYPDGTDVPVKEFADKVHADLLPLNAVGPKLPGETRYENVTLPSATRGEVANYTERVYESPVKTSAGDIHFGREYVHAPQSPNYFAHTRIEDLPNPEIKGFAADFPETNSKGGTRRVIEIQSDLFQKGKLEGSLNKSSAMTDATVMGGIRDLYNMGKESGKTEQEIFATLRAARPDQMKGINTIDELKAELSRREESASVDKKLFDEQLSRLEPYRNTWHERVIREEVKQAAIDGKTKLQFPTGETAMKIEGLGQIGLHEQGSFMHIPNGARRLTRTLPEHLKIGMTVVGREGDSWVITDVLGDGKFKAVPKADEYEIAGAGGYDEWLKQMKARNAEETFDISDKIDTNNPIYRFYEKEVGRYLKNKYNAQLVTDARGVTWWEVKVDPAMAKKPVSAYRRGTPRFDPPMVTEKEMRRLIHEVAGIPEDMVDIIFDVNIQKNLGEGVQGRYTPGVKDKLKPVIRLYSSNGQVRVGTGFHESWHYVEDNFLTAKERAEMREIAQKEMGPLSKLAYNKYSAEEKLQEFLADKYADYLKNKVGYRMSPLRKFFLKIDLALKKIVNAIEKVKAYFEGLPNKEGGFIKNPLGSSDVPPPDRGPARTSSEKAPGSLPELRTSPETKKLSPAISSDALNNISPEKAIAEVAKSTGDSEKMVNRTLDNFKKINTAIAETVSDRTRRVREIVEKAKNLGGKVAEESDPFLAMTLYDGRVGARIEAAKGEVKAIVSDMNALAKDGDIAQARKDVSDYLVARHAPERNAKLGEKAAGITDEEAIARKAELEAKNPEIVKVADRVQALHNQTLDMLRDAGVISDELYTTLRETYKNHVPLQRIFDDVEGSSPVLGGKGYDVRSTGLKRAKGSEREVEDVFTNIITGYQEAVLRSEKNIVDLSTLRFVEENKELVGDLFEVSKPRAIGKDFSGKLLMEQTQDPQILQMFDKGKRVWIKIKDPKLATAFRGVNKFKLDPILNAVATFTRLYSGLNTRFNPEFALPNKIRDLQETMVYLAAQDGIGFKASGKMATKDPKSTKDVLDFLRGKDTPGARLYAELKDEGGTTGGFGLSTKKQVEIDLDKLERLAKSKTKRIANNLVEYIDDWNTIFEDSTRLSVYKQARENGLSKKRAAYLAKEASINFNRMGTAGPLINGLYMFSNASIRGSVKMLSSLKNPKVLGAVVLAVTAGVAATSEWNDEVDPEWRDKVPKWDRLNGLTVVLPSEDDDFHYITIPVSWGIKPIKVMTDYAYDATTGHGFDAEAATKDIIVTLVEAYNPAGGTDLISALVPTILDTPVDIGRNKKWSGSQIKPTKYNPNTPEDVRYFKSLRDTFTGRATISISEILQDKLGVAVSPADMKYAYEQYVGGAGRAASKVANLMAGALPGVDAPPLDEYPMISRFYRQSDAEEVGAGAGGETEELRQLNAEQERKRHQTSMEAQDFIDEISGLSKQEVATRLVEIGRSNPELFAKIKDAVKTEAKNLSSTDRLIESLGVENGERAAYIVKKARELKTPAEVTAYLAELAKKGLLTKAVIKQMGSALTK